MLQCLLLVKRTERKLGNPSSASGGNSGNYKEISNAQMISMDLQIKYQQLIVSGVTYKPMSYINSRGNLSGLSVEIRSSCVCAKGKCDSLTGVSVLYSAYYQKHSLG